MRDFYEEILARLLRERFLRTDASILIVCGGEEDRRVFEMLGFGNVVISNLDARMKEGDYAPFQWRLQNAESLTYADESFDFVVVHSGLHHCRSPHKGLLEMYRVAREGLIVFEPYDNLLTRMGTRFGFGQDYEHATVFFNDCRFGGVANSEIPNYVYRFTEREILKTLRSAAPHVKHSVSFYHRLHFPWSQIRGSKTRVMYYLAILGSPLLRLLHACFPRQSNQFAAVIRKPVIPRDLHPWIRVADERMSVDAEWLDSLIKRTQSKD